MISATGLHFRRRHSPGGEYRRTEAECRWSPGAPGYRTARPFLFTVIPARPRAASASLAGHAQFAEIRQHHVVVGAAARPAVTPRATRALGQGPGVGHHLLLVGPEPIGLRLLEGPRPWRRSRASAAAPECRGKDLPVDFSVKIGLGQDHAPPRGPRRVLVGGGGDHVGMEAWARGGRRPPRARRCGPCPP